MERISDLLSVYRESIKKSLENIRSTPYIVFIVPLASIIYGALQLVSMGISANSRLGAFLMPIINTLIVSLVFYQLERSTNYGSLDFTSIRSGMSMYFYNIYLIRFIFYILRLFAGNILSSSYMGFSLYSLVFIVLNPIGEVIYLKNREGLNSLSYSLDFLRENWYIWTIHVLIFLFYSASIYNTNMILPFDIYIRNGSILLYRPVYLVFMIIDSLYLVFRANMFKILMDSNIRKRKYMGMFK